jgi:hypothetical protein
MTKEKEDTPDPKKPPLVPKEAFVEDVFVSLPPEDSVSMSGTSPLSASGYLADMESLGGL